ncbi:hypothetical protein IFM61392_05377 [Aspergillus lentulus]|nr:hypothetical protein CNMCM7927_005827 [Aspergillus lentulus]GFG08453.1 hypothetical protein IFM61392_05377 [Aspergillus lentulus]
MPIHEGTFIHLVVTNDNPTAAKEKAVEINHGADTQLHRSLGIRYLTMIAFGSAIGMGMWLGSGQALIRGGPAALFIGYVISSSMIWAIFKKADKTGRSWAGYVLTLTMDGALAYLNVSHTGAEVVSWLSSRVSLLTLFGWAMICLSHLRFRYAWKLQERSDASRVDN